ncbi:MAG TPA: DUF1573 domain-containing protein [Paludibacter sp.]|nr:DUF1573 domain-containing protein [Paludibacter sp.]
MRKFGFLVACLVFSVLAIAQKAVISFDVKSHDFGKINEDDGKATYVFDFKNEGNSPLVVTNVKASCGCTTPSWTKEPIEPGKKGSITVSYNPQGRPGTFSKIITVTSNASEEQVQLSIKGEVLSKAAAENVPYPVNLGGILLKSKVVKMDNIQKGKTRAVAVEFQNGTKQNVKINIENLPPYITVSVSPETVKPFENGKMTFTFNSKKCPQWGPVSDEVFLNVNGQKKRSEDVKMSVAGNVVEDFSTMTLEQKRKAPILEIQDRTLNLGVIKAGTKCTGKFKISNKGQTSLEIRRILNYNTEILLRGAKLSVPGGRTSELHFQVNAKDLPVGKYRKAFTLQTNDPDNSYTILTVTGIVQK